MSATTPSLQGLPSPSLSGLSERPVDTQYEDLLRLVKTTGTAKSDRTGTGTRSIFGHQLRFNLETGFPLMTTKKVYFPAVVSELLWFLRGESNIQWLHRHNVKIWDEWADAEGELGPVYGVQWRSWPTPDGGAVDQITELIHLLRTNPDSRRMVVSAWNVAQLPQMALPPCHVLFQFYVADGKLSCQLYQRSADLFLGLPFNIASYALLTHLIAQEVNLGVGDFIWSGGDCHLYDNHQEQAATQLERTPFPFPQLKFTPRGTLFEYEPGDFSLQDYQHHPAIKAPIAI